jgi:hypothetical protein
VADDYACGAGVCGMKSAAGRQSVCMSVCNRGGLAAVTAGSPCNIHRHCHKRSVAHAPEQHSCAWGGRRSQCAVIRAVPLARGVAAAVLRAHRLLCNLGVGKGGLAAARGALQICGSRHSTSTGQGRRGQQHAGRVSSQAGQVLDGCRCRAALRRVEFREGGPTHRG